MSALAEIAGQRVAERAGAALLFAAALGCSAPALVPVPLPRAGGGGQLLQQRIGLSCEGAAPGPARDVLEAFPPPVAARCGFLSEAIVQNPSARPAIVEVEIKGRSAEGVTHDVDREGTAGSLSGSFREVRRVALGAGELRALRAAGVIHLAEDSWERATVPALAARHPVIAWAGGERRLRFDLPPGLFDFGVDRAPTVLRVEYPEAWSLEVYGAPPRAPAPPSRPGFAAEEHATAQPARVGGELVLQGGIENGGPLVGLGASTEGGPGDDPWRLTAALGYELGVRDWLVASAIVDSDFHHRVAAGLTLEAATPYVRTGGLLFPSIALGLGVPARFAEEAAAGGRVVVTLSFPSIGVAAYADYYPALDRFERVILLRGSI